MGQLIWESILAFFAAVGVVQVARWVWRGFWRRRQRRQKRKRRQGQK